MNGQYKYTLWRLDTTKHSIYFYVYYLHILRVKKKLFRNDHVLHFMKYAKMCLDFRILANVVQVQLLI